MEKKTGVIILNYNNSLDTINCIESFLTINSSPAKIIVVDNGSNIGAVEIIEKFLLSKKGLIINESLNKKMQSLPMFTLVKSEANLGYANGNKIGLRYAFSDSEIDKVLIVNNDILFVDNILPKLRAFEEVHSDAGVVSPILYTKDLADYDYTCARKSPNDWLLLLKYMMMDLSTFNLSEYFDRKNYIIVNDKEVLKQDSIKVDLPSGSCMFIDKQLFKSIHDFDENTFLYYEENILYKKLNKIGKQNYVIPSIRCIHLGASSTKAKPSYFLIKCNSESGFYYLENYCKLNFLQKIMLFLAKKAMNIKIQIFKSK